jgi:hypothetical protein
VLPRVERKSTRRRNAIAVTLSAVIDTDVLWQQRTVRECAQSAISNYVLFETPTGTNFDARDLGALMEVKTTSREMSARTRSARRDASCACCGERSVRNTASTRFCAICLERSSSYDAQDPYDELGGGD